MTDALAQFLAAVTFEESWKANPCLREQALELFGDFGIRAGQDPIEIFDDRDLGAEPLPDRAELEPDHPCSDTKR